MALNHQKTGENEYFTRFLWAKVKQIRLCVMKQDSGVTGEVRAAMGDVTAGNAKRAELMRHAQ